MHMKNLSRNNRGAALVEFAIVVLLLLTLVFGIIEFGLAIKDYLTISHAAREGARLASLGGPTGNITTRIDNSAIALDTGSLSITLQTRTGDSGSWTALGNVSDGTNTYNSANAGDQIQVIVSYPHELTTGSLFAPILGEDGVIDLSSSIVTRREL